MPKAYPKLNFPPIKLRAQRLADKQTLSVWSAIRGCYLVLTPEEWVRRHLVEYLIAEHGVLPTQMVEEYPVLLNGQPQRADLVVVSQGKPLILAECKAPTVKLTQETLAQAARYNSVVGAKFIIITNGLTHLCFEFVGAEYKPLSQFPAQFR